MAITDEDRAKLGDLAMRGIDQIIEHYGEDASLEDAVLLFEVAHPDPEFEATWPYRQSRRVTKAGGSRLKATTVHSKTAGGALDAR